MKKAYIITILVVLTIVHVLFIRNCRLKKDIEGYQLPANVVIEGLIEQQVSAMKLLSVEETLQQLDKMEYYEWPGAFIGVGTMYLVDNDGNYFVESLYESDKIELEKILSNRMFRKSLQDMSQLSKGEASKLLKSEIDDALLKYMKLYNGSFESQEQYAKLSILDTMDGQPTLASLRYKLFALLLLAGSLGLTEVHGTIKEIDDTAQKQRINISRIEDSEVRGNYMLGVLLHNNLILSSGLYGTSPRKADTKLKPFTSRYVDHKLVDFSAPATEYDTMVRHGVQVPTPDKGYINLRYFDQMTNEDLNELRRILD